ncbi:TetR/AcrR family transcriptional regulator [Maribellus sp. YY47]|uniref:TetR/AcrR family transcriptional regulator n=1 Tax=Maribellus sp. YY47 TaxID=2929486 RepID=UPI002000D52E|nr:TetR/AcrR family transcriptional regulator [Maribellus sp. YY47]MCK3683164.1 TetR/AcrR family transcriptional regulator [Maribellus sp. YY47]
MNDLKKDNTEEKILIAAQNVFIEKGMDGARMQAIADEAGINKALLHYYFRTKEKLFNAIFIKVFSQIFPNLMTMVLSDLPLEEKLGAFVETYIDMLQKNPFLPTFILKEMNRNPDFLASVIKGSGVNPQEISNMFKKEMEAGKIKRMDPREVLINIIALSIFPIAAGPLISVMFFENDKTAYNEFIEKRKKTITEFVLDSILLK